MSLGELLLSIYVWCDERALEILIVALVIPVLGTGLAWVGKLGRTDRDGRFIASVVVVLGVVAFMVAVMGLVIAYAAFDGSVLDANLALLVAPVVCLAGCLLGIKLVFSFDGAGFGSITDRYRAFSGRFAGGAVVVLAIPWLGNYLFWWSRAAGYHWRVRFLFVTAAVQKSGGPRLKEGVRHD